MWTQIGESLLPAFPRLFQGRGFADVCAENVATDLESFSSHAGRTTVTTDDVLLLARKNPDLLEIMKEFIDKSKAEKEATKGRGGAGAGAGAGAAAKGRR